MSQALTCPRYVLQDRHDGGDPHKRSTAEVPVKNTNSTEHVLSIPLYLEVSENLRDNRFIKRTHPIGHVHRLTHVEYDGEQGQVPIRQE